MKPVRQPLTYSSSNGFISFHLVEIVKSGCSLGLIRLGLFHKVDFLAWHSQALALLGPCTGLTDKHSLFVTKLNIKVCNIQRHSNGSVGEHIHWYIIYIIYPPNTRPSTSDNNVRMVTELISQWVLKFYISPKQIYGYGIIYTNTNHFDSYFPHNPNVRQLLPFHWSPIPILLHLHCQPNPHIYQTTATSESVCDIVISSRQPWYEIW